MRKLFGVLFIIMAITAQTLAGCYDCAVAPGSNCPYCQTVQCWVDPVTGDRTCSMAGNECMAICGGPTGENKCIIGGDCDLIIQSVGFDARAAFPDIPKRAFKLARTVDGRAALPLRDIRQGLVSPVTLATGRLVYAFVNEGGGFSRYVVESHRNIVTGIYTITVTPVNDGHGLQFTLSADTQKLESFDALR